MRKEKGITLIALVVTIIVLLILAGVCVAALTGENGLIRQANRADVRTRAAEIEERVNIEFAAMYSEILYGKTSFTSSDLSTLTANLSEISQDITIAPTSITGTADEITVSVKSTSEAYGEFDPSKVTATINTKTQVVTLLDVKE